MHTAFNNPLAVKPFALLKTDMSRDLFLDEKMDRPITSQTFQ